MNDIKTAIEQLKSRFGYHSYKHSKTPMKVIIPSSSKELIREYLIQKQMKNSNLK